MDVANTFSTKEINLQLQRILDSVAFRNSPTLARFLSFVISETVLEKEQHIKEYSIAVNVLNRPPDFNPHDDAVVRIHAGRLRRALNDYYLIQGINDPIIIHIPKGGYIPQFELGVTGKTGRRTAPIPPETGVKPIVVVFPFRTMPQSPDVEQFSLILGEQLSAELSRFQDLSVIGYYSMEMTSKIELNILEAGKLVNADYIINGSLQNYDQRIHVQVNLLKTATGEIMMTKSFEREFVFSGIIEMQDEIVKSVIGRVGGYWGIIFQEIAKTAPIQVSGNPGVQEAIYNYYKYQRSYSSGSYHTALASLEQAVNNYPGHAVCRAMLGELYLDGIGLGITKDRELQGKGYQYALESVKIDPLCLHAWLTLAWAHLFRGEKEACRDAAHQCIGLNPNYSIIVCRAGCILICAGYFDEGFQIIDKAVKLNPYYSWWINAGFSLYYLYKKEYALSVFWTEKMNADDTFLGLLLKSVALSNLGNKVAAGEYLSRLISMEPETPGKIRSMLSTVTLSDELITHMIEGLERIGFRQAQ
jgi:TolB-like protein